MLFGKKKEGLLNGIDFQDLYSLYQDDKNLNLSQHGNLKNFFERVDQETLRRQNQYNHAMADVNHLSQYMMKMDFVKEMISLLHVQTSSIAMVTETTEEMSNSIVAISELVMDNSEAARKSVQVTEDGTAQLVDAVDMINDAFTLTGQAKDKVEDVTQESLKIKEMVSIIESVAEQTNLLALNASIEAARAGEAGRGFAVVADEIRKLAESTTDSVTRIQSVVDSLNASVTSAVSAIERATDSFQKGIDHVNDASRSVEASKNEVISILDGLENVGSKIQEQTAATEETAATVAEINENTKTLHTQTQRSGKAFSDIAKEVDILRNELLDDADLVSTKDMIEVTMTDHMNWRWRVYNMLLGYETIDMKEVTDHRGCRLGLWLDKEIRNLPEFKRYVDRIDGPHKALHQAVSDAVKHYHNGRVDQAESCLEDIDRLNEEVLSILSEMMGVTIKDDVSIGVFKWSNKLTVYNDEMDRQHKQLLSIGHKLVEFSESSKKSKKVFLSIVDELKSYTVYHFAEEEKLMARLNYPTLGAHKKIHEGFVKEVTSVDFDSFDYKNPMELKKLITFLSKWVVQHIKNEDYKYIPYVED